MASASARPRSASQRAEETDSSGVGDQVDLILRQWADERPDLDASPMAVIGRIMRASRHLDRELAGPYKRAGLDFGLFDVLATLRRSGRPFQLSAGELKHWCMLTSGAMTARLDRLEQGGLVVRQSDPDDRRGVLIALSPEGKRLIDRLVVEHLENEKRLLFALSRDERETLAALLRRLLLDYEGVADAGDRTSLISS